MTTSQNIYVNPWKFDHCVSSFQTITNLVENMNVSAAQFEKMKKAYMDIQQESRTLKQVSVTRILVVIIQSRLQIIHLIVNVVLTRTI